MIRFSRLSDSTYVVLGTDADLTHFIRLGIVKKVPELSQWLFIPEDKTKSWGLGGNRRNAYASAFELDIQKERYFLTQSQECAAVNDLLV